MVSNRLKTGGASEQLLLWKCLLQGAGWLGGFITAALRKMACVQVNLTVIQFHCSKFVNIIYLFIKLLDPGEF